MVELKRIYWMRQALRLAYLPDEPHLAAQVVIARLAGIAFVADKIGFDDDVVPLREARHPFADFRDSPGEFVPQRHRGVLVVRIQSRQSRVSIRAAPLALARMQRIVVNTS
jgi:hypothetical protein